MAGAEAQGPVRPPPPPPPPPRPKVYYHNLQEIHDDHDVVGSLIRDSKTRWLRADEISQILREVEKGTLTLSLVAPPKKTLGLFVFNTPSYFDHRWWDGHKNLGVRQQVTENGETITRTESVMFLHNEYIKRVQRQSAKFRDLVVVHYRMIR